MLLEHTLPWVKKYLRQKNVKYTLKIVAIDTAE
jgi:hypothetical protein